jgi:hypothetical protein
MPYKKGESGNPGGRPKGSQNVNTRFYEFLETHVKDPYGWKLLAKSYEKAIEGNTRLLELWTNRFSPALRLDNYITMQFESEDLVKRCEEVFEGIASGKLTPSEGETFMKVLRGYSELKHDKKLLKIIKDKIAEVEKLTNQDK